MYVCMCKQTAICNIFYYLLDDVQESAPKREKRQIFDPSWCLINPRRAWFNIVLVCVCVCVCVCVLCVCVLCGVCVCVCVCCHVFCHHVQ